MCVVRIAFVASFLIAGMAPYQSVLPLLLATPDQAEGTTGDTGDGAPGTALATIGQFTHLTSDI